jgi:hypothetical protein
MRRIPLIGGLVLISGLIVQGIYDFAVTNEGIRYFLSEPMRLAYVMLLGVSGGIVALSVSRSSSTSQRNLKLLALGGFGIFLIGGTAFMAYLFHSLRTAPVVYEGAASGWIFAGFISAALAGCLVSWEFARVWRQTQ